MRVPSGDHVRSYDHDQHATSILAIVGVDGDELWSGRSGWGPRGTALPHRLPAVRDRVEREGHTP